MNHRIRVMMRTTITAPIPAYEMAPSKRDRVTASNRATDHSTARMMIPVPRVPSAMAGCLELMKTNLACKKITNVWKIGNCS